MENKCYKCESKSVIQDGHTWVCYEHITPCKCPKNHTISSERDFRSITIEEMESQSPDIRLESFYKETMFKR